MPFIPFLRPRISMKSWIEGKRKRVSKIELNGSVLLGEVEGYRCAVDLSTGGYSCECRRDEACPHVPAAIIEASRRGLIDTLWKYEDFYDYLRTIKEDFVPNKMQLSVKEVDPFKNLLIIAPTGSGKTITSLYRAFEVIRSGGKVVYVAPTRSLVYQMAVKFGRYFPFLKDEDMLVFGSKDFHVTARGFRRSRLAVLTPFKLALLMRLAPDAMKDVDLLIVDEIHTMDPITEFILTQTIMFSNYNVIAMTATLSETDIKGLSGWLKAVPIIHEVRPVPLEEYVVLVNDIKVKWKGKEYYLNSFLDELDDMVSNLAAEIIGKFKKEQKRSPDMDELAQLRQEIRELSRKKIEEEIDNAEFFYEIVIYDRGGNTVLKTNVKIPKSLVDSSADVDQPMYGLRRLYRGENRMAVISEYLRTHHPDGKPIGSDVGVLIFSRSIRQANRTAYVLATGENADLNSDYKGRDFFQSMLDSGVGIVHTNVPADLWMKSVELAESGEINHIVNVGMLRLGVNLSMDVVTIYMDSSREMSVEEYKQKAGRAGRQGKSRIGVGYSYIITTDESIDEALELVKKEEYGRVTGIVTDKWDFPLLVMNLVYSLDRMKGGTARVDEVERVLLNTYTAYMMEDREQLVKDFKTTLMELETDGLINIDNNVVHLTERGRPAAALGIHPHAYKILLDMESKLDETDTLDEDTKFNLSFTYLIESLKKYVEEKNIGITDLERSVEDILRYGSYVRLLSRIDYNLVDEAQRLAELANIYASRFSNSRKIRELTEWMVEATTAGANERLKLLMREVGRKTTRVFIRNFPTVFESWFQKGGIDEDDIKAIFDFFSSNLTRRTLSEMSRFKRTGLYRLLKVLGVTDEKIREFLEPFTKKKSVYV